MQQITTRNTTSLKPYSRNARKHSDKQVHKIAESIKRFGFNNPILIDGDGTIIAGHGRWQAAQLLGLAEVPTICLDHLKENEVRAYIIADNKLAELAGWDVEILAIELQHLSSLELDFSIEITGFETGEIDFLIEEASAAKADPIEEVVDRLLDEPSITKVGDLWQLGEHKLYCGDSLKPESYKNLLQDELAQTVFTDPPYNVPINGHVCGNGAVKHREFEMASGEMTKAEFTQFLATAFGLMKSSMVEGALIYCCMDWRHMGEVLQASLQHKLELKNLCVWVKDNGGMGSFYRSRHELVFVLKSDDSKHINNIQLGKYGRNRTNVWEYPGVNSRTENRIDELKMHPTVKPVKLVADAIMDCTKRRDLILDPFSGSGTTLIAAEKTGRRARLIELDAHYCDVIIKRWENMTGQTAVRIGGYYE